MAPPRSNPSTHLLPGTQNGDYHPIFSRTCHSPWAFLHQPQLAILRALVTTYLAASVGLTVSYQFHHQHLGWEMAFDFPNIALLLQLIYSIIATIWTYMHYKYPRHSSDDDSFSGKMKRFFSPPKTNRKTENRTFFSIFYTIANSTSVVAAAIYWCVLVPSGQTNIPPHEGFQHGAHQSLYYLNRYVMIPLIAVIEVFLFSAIKQPYPIGAHMLGHLTFSSAYIGWAFTERAFFNRFPYFFFDAHAVGGDYAWVAAFFFIAAGQIGFWFLYCITALREELIKKTDDAAITDEGEDDSYNYRAI